MAGFLEDGKRRLKVQFPALRHGVPCIDADIQQSRFQQNRIQFAGGQVFGQVECNLDIFAQ